MMRARSLAWAVVLGLVACTPMGNPNPQPPPPRSEEIPKPPVTGESMIWQPGHWEWTGNGYAWQQGEWVKSIGHSAEWLNGHWEDQAGTWTWVPGHWL